MRGETLGIVFLPQGPSDAGCPSISSLRPGSASGRSDQLSPGDRVRSVNGINTTRMRADEISSLLDNVIGDTATLELQYNLPEYSSQGSLCVQTKVTTVTLERVDGSLGITLRGGAPPSSVESQTPSPTPGSQNKPLVVTHVRPGGPAHRSGRIKVGDRLLSVDHHSLSNKTLLDAHSLLKQATQTSTSLTSLTSSLTTLTIEYDVSNLDSVRSAGGPLLVEVERRPREALGLVLGPQEACDVTGVYIEAVVGGSVADRCGALHTGDQILAVDDTYIAGTSATAPEVTWLLQNYDTSQGCTRIQIMPCHALGHGLPNNEWGQRVLAPPSPSISSFSTSSRRRRPRHQHRVCSTSCTAVTSQPPPGVCHVETLTVAVTSHADQGFGLAVHTDCEGDTQANIVVSSVQHDSPAHRRRRRPRHQHRVCSTSCTAVTSQPPPGVCHVETLTVAVTSHADQGFGLAVHTDCEGDTQANIVVSSVQHDSPAHRCGCLQVGDRLISLNGQCSLTLQEVRALLDLGLTNPGHRLVLQTEFDVADAVVPASGVFTVRIAKNGPDLGITITASKTIQDDPFIISDIRRGSAAHRTGTLHIGDQVLSIDNRTLDQLSLDDAFDSVQSSQGEIVTLRIQKIEEHLRPAQILEQPEEIIYTVELNRRGGPLGITVSGSEDRTEPIVLSALTQGGLAEKTGALHIGDRILAINNENLEHRPLSDAIRLLQTSGDKIQIKIARQIKNNSDDSRGNFSSPGLTSIDSAVESWDSGILESSLDNPSTLVHLPVNNSNNENIHIEPTVLFSSFSNQNSNDYSVSNGKYFGNKKLHESQILFYSDVEDSLCPSPLPLPNYNFTNTLPKYDSSYFFCSKPNLSTRSEYKYSKDIDTYSETTVPDVEIHYVTLHKDSVYDDYGFSVSDGLYEKGVYINRIRRGGPAHLAGVLRPYDRILQVNDTKTKDFDCCLTVPLIASAGDKIELVIARNPYIGCPDEKDMHELSWTPEDQDIPRISTKSFSSSQNTITKTL